ncbi:hypothetical protein GCL60_00415 [Silvanigrella paludirubra]|uniref:DDH domain-containing protein n=1 Tax=Silvanigrella paludirubra TaxID=2499159 RepID=A0A6N6VYY0_9BACT|nr:DHHA1 domain-containing protein [Silvanigrella paludirubra]KAB8040412.1 hypothetical protein GCL60_00415 [Silvanigrella paludirubra]
MDSKRGLFLVICDDPELASTLVHIQKNMDIKVWLPNKQNQLQTSLIEACEDSDKVDDILVKGDITKPSFFSQWKEYDPICVVLSLKDNDKYSNVREMLLEELPESRILSFQIGHPEEVPRKLVDNDRELVLSWTELLSRPISAELRHIESTHRVKEIRDILMEGDKIALLLQPDPDPDGLASALALRCLLGRNKVSTPICSFGKVTRPENIAMMQLLDLEVITIKPEDLINYDKVAMLDTQPAHFTVTLPRVDVIIDHHPMVANYSHIPYCDIRSKYGATSTILTEYLRAAAVNIGQRLATALLYGIKADTLHLNREVIDADLYAFVSLYPDINYNLLRRMEKPELPMRFAPVLANALLNMAFQDKILVSFIGNVEREDLIPQVADFMLQFENIEWVVCVGIFENNIVMSVRNVGYVKNAGDVVRRILNGIGSGGGHRTMAKAIFPVAGWKDKFGSITEENIRSTVLNLFLEEAT